MAERRSCSICGKQPVKARGLCGTHYEKDRTRGSQPVTRPISAERHAPSPGGRGPARPNGGSPTVRKVADRVGSGIALLNAAGARYIPALRDDALNPTEIGVLAVATAEEIVSNKRLLAWYQRIGSEVTGPHTKMAAALAYVAAPRLARRGIMPQEVADEMGLILFALITAEPDELLAGEMEKEEPAPTPAHAAPITDELALIAIDQVAALEPEPVRG